MNGMQSHLHVPTHASIYLSVQVNCMPSLQQVCSVITLRIESSIISTDSNITDNIIRKVMSLMYSRKGVGPWMDPTETPAMTGYFWEDFPSRTTWSHLLLRKEEIKYIVVHLNRTELQTQASKRSLIQHFWVFYLNQMSENICIEDMVKWLILFCISSPLKVH